MKCSGRIVEVEPIPGDPDRMIVFGSVFYRTGWDAVGFRPIHIVPIEKLAFPLFTNPTGPLQELP